TMVDTLLSIRAAGYQGTVWAVSRNGLLPQVHDGIPPHANDVCAAEMFAQHTKPLSQLMRKFRHETDISMRDAHSWQPVFHHWRPHLPHIWQRLNMQDRRKFMRRLFTIWGVH